MPELMGFDLWVIAAAVVLIIILIAGVKQVPQGYNYTVERFGRYVRTL